MSEHLRHKHESHHAPEHLVSHEHLAEIDKHKQEKAREAEEKAAEQDIEQLRQTVHETADKGRLLGVEKAEDEPAATYGTHQELKTGAYVRTLENVRRQLPKTARAFSKVTHSPVVETVSNVSAQTVARPSGLLGGSLGAFAGSAVLLYMSKHYGFRYNYLLFVLLFVGGFALGLVLELIIWLAWRRRHPAN